MKSEKNILIAFVLNFAFSIFELVGGIFTGSVAIISDSLHDIGDAASIGIAYFLEKKSKKQPDNKYTYGYARYSVLGSIITMLILLLGSVFIIYNATRRIIEPVKINYNGMIVFAIIGVCVNYAAALITHKGDSLNQKAVNLHMLEDVLTWIVVLAGAVIMKFTEISIIDPTMSIGVAIFILANAIKNLKEATVILLDKTPCEINIEEIKEQLCHIDGVLELHNIHIWSIDGQNNSATMHIRTNKISPEIKAELRKKLCEYGITYTTLELEEENEHCQTELKTNSKHEHHHRH